MHRQGKVGLGRGRASGTASRRARSSGRARSCRARARTCRSPTSFSRGWRITQLPGTRRWRPARASTVGAAASPTARGAMPLAISALVRRRHVDWAARQEGAGEEALFAIENAQDVCKQPGRTAPPTSNTCETPASRGHRHAPQTRRHRPLSGVQKAELWVYKLSKKTK